MKKSDLKTLSSNTFTTNGTRGITAQAQRAYNESAIDSMYLNAGSIVIWPGLFANIPTGWHLADGSQVSIDDYPDLYAALGSALSPWGGNGVDKFNLPNIPKWSVPVQVDDQTLADSGGERTHLLKASEIPSHFHYNGVANDLGSGFIYGATTSDVPGSATTSVKDEENARIYQGKTSSYGGSLEHNNMPPYVGMFYIVKLY